MASWFRLAEARIIATCLSCSVPSLGGCRAAGYTLVEAGRSVVDCGSSCCSGALSDCSPRSADSPCLAGPARRYSTPEAPGWADGDG